MAKELNYKNALFDLYKLSHAPQAITLWSNEIKSIPAWIAALNKFYNYGDIKINDVIDMFSAMEPGAVYLPDWNGAPKTYKYTETFAFVPKVLRSERFEQGIDGWHNVISPESNTAKQLNYISFMDYMANLKSIVLLNKKKKKKEEELSKYEKELKPSEQYKKYIRFQFFQNLCEDAISSIQGSVFMVNVKEKSRWIKNNQT